MKKFLALVCTLGVITSLTACSRSDETAEVVQTETIEESVTETETEKVSVTERDVLGETISAEERTMPTEREPANYGELFLEIDSEFVQEEADTAREIALRACIHREKVI